MITTTPVRAEATTTLASGSTSLYDHLFRQSLRIRLVEERIIELYPTDCIQSPVHLSIGQEAVAAGLCHPLTPSDLLFGTYRGHALYLAKGGCLKAMMAELFGRVDGCGRGKAGSMHLAAPEVGFMGASAVVGSSIPHAVGAALASKRLRKGQVCVAVFGDGATEEGVYHESLNFAVLRRLPVIFVCENNGLAVHSKQADRQAYSILDHAKTYGLPVTLVKNGFDFMEIQGVFSRIVDAVRHDSWPRFVEIRTCRYKEHVGPGEDFEAGYRSQADWKRWAAQDPLLLHPERVRQWTPAILEEIDEAVAFARQSPVPDRSELLADVI